MKWTQEELEKLYQEVNARAAADAEFRKAVLADPKGEMEKLAGRELPDDFNLKFIETDNGYAAAYVVPDFVQGELEVRELRDEDLEAAAGGISFALIVSICAAAVSTGPCAADGCGANVCGGNVCGGNVCGADGCGGNVCAANAGGGAGCGGATCAADSCGADGCGGNAGCAAYASGIDDCAGYVGCTAYVTA